MGKGEDHFAIFCEQMVTFKQLSLVTCSKNYHEQCSEAEILMGKVSKHNPRC